MFIYLTNPDMSGTHTHLDNNGTDTLIVRVTPNMDSVKLINGYWRIVEIVYVVLKGL